MVHRPSNGNQVAYGKTNRTPPSSYPRGYNSHLLDRPKRWKNTSFQQSHSSNPPFPSTIWMHLVQRWPVFGILNLFPPCCELIFHGKVHLPLICGYNTGNRCILLLLFYTIFFFLKVFMVFHKHKNKQYNTLQRHYWNAANKHIMSFRPIWPMGSIVPSQYFQIPTQPTRMVAGNGTIMNWVLKVQLSRNKPK